AAAPAPAESTVMRRAVVPEPVLLGASSPRAVRPGDEFTARFVAYIKSLETEIRRTLEGLSPESVTHLGVHTCRWTPGTRVSVRLSAAHLTVDPPEETFEWSGERNLVEFDARVDENAPAGKTILMFDVSIDGVRVAKLRVDLVIATTADASTGAVIAEPARTAFASYSSEDRARVLDRIASVRTSANIDVFLDCLSIHPGEHWKARLASEIEQRDIFLLFWSNHARKSQWVEWEWKTALESRGIDNIEPHPLDPVAAAPPPPELSELHFGDPLMLVRQQNFTTESREDTENGR
ncbi:MAG: toll/interleukin-1 receptor domain-containing protein, partial [Longimicrobiales bacterium]